MARLLHHGMKNIFLSLAWAAGCGLSLAAWADPHEHGVVRLQLALDGPVLSVALQTPLDNLLGFERAPRTAAERQAAQELLARLGQGQGVLQPDPAAGCSLQQASVQSEVLKPGSPSAARGHADLQAQLTWRCSQPGLLASATVELFDGYRRVRQIQVQMVLPRGQSQVVLKRQQRQLNLR